MSRKTKQHTKQFKLNAINYRKEHPNLTQVECAKNLGIGVTLAPRVIENQNIKKIILQIYSDYDKCFGAYKITYILGRDYGINISVGRVYRLMSNMNLPKMVTDKPHRRGKHSDNGECPNHLNQEFNQKAPNIVWASDFTYIKVGCKWYYLCVVIDLFSRKVIGWTLSGKPNVDLVLSEFKKAYSSRHIQYGLFHSDRGSQYTAFAFRQLLDSLNVVQSFSKKEYPFDNACCESFFKYLKKECTNRHTYHTVNQLRRDLFEYIESFYNNRRPHGSLEYLTPNEVEATYWGQQA